MPRANIYTYIGYKVKVKLIQLYKKNQYNTIQHNVQNNTTQRNATQYNTIQNRKYNAMHSIQHKQEYNAIQYIMITLFPSVK